MSELPSGAPAEILLVEDSEGDIRLTREALRDSKIVNNLHVVMDGVEAMDFLYGRGEYSGAKRPDLIILDLNLPRKDGREVLEEIKSNDDLKLIPVAVLTTSKDDEDVIQSYSSHANCYIRKPLDMEGFFKVVTMIENFWFQIVKLPPNR